MTKRYQLFAVKLCNLLLIILCIALYQNIAVKKEDERAVILKQINDNEEYNDALIKKAYADLNTEGPYANGVFSGTAAGFGGDIVVEVSVEQGFISDIEVVNHDKEDDAFYSQAEAVVDEIIKSNNTQVDTVSGATFSSKGIIEAVEEALSKAVK